LLVFREGNVMAYNFDEGRGEIVGEPVTVVQRVGNIVASGLFSASRSGVLAYRSGGVATTRLMWYDRQGAGNSAEGFPTALAVALSPRGDRAALVRQDPGDPNWTIWTWDTVRGSSLRLTFSPRRAEAPVWSPQENYLFFASNRDGTFNLYRKPANESKNDDVLLNAGPDRTPTGISQDGGLLLYTQREPETKNDIWVLSNPTGEARDRKASVFLNGDANEHEGRFSPQPATPRWVAFTSDITGRNEVHVREYSPNGRTWRVSAAGGSNPRWRADGRELFFAAVDGTAMSVDVTPGASFDFNAPKVVFRPPTGMLPNWDVTADGKRFLVLSQVQQSAQAPFTVLLNWQTLLKK
jgi:hypothetical protein